VTKTADLQFLPRSTETRIVLSTTVESEDESYCCDGHQPNMIAFLAQFRKERAELWGEKYRYQDDSLYNDLIAFVESGRYTIDYVEHTEVVVTPASIKCCNQRLPLVQAVTPCPVCKTMYNVDGTVRPRAYDLTPGGMIVFNNEENRLLERSDAYHNHPSHASDCVAYQEMYSKRCPCERYVK
jgi:hypothetical protein